MVKIFLKTGLHKAKSQGSKTYCEATLFPILTVDKLLPSIERSHYLGRIQEIVNLSDEYFSVFYEELVDRFALFVQVLPEAYGEELGGLLNDGLRRALLAIQIIHETQEKPHPLFVFTVFSIALLSDLGLALQYRVMISDEKGNYIGDWYPCLGPMSDFGYFYKLRYCEETSQSLMRSVTPLLARQLLSDTAITWLSSNNQMFNMWLTFLNKGEDWAGGFLKILKIDPKQFENRKGEMSLFSIDIKLFEPMGTDLGEKFLSWLKAGLLDGTISFNEADSLVHVFNANELDLSVFIQTPELFQRFCHLFAGTADWTVVCKQFGHLGLTRLSGNDLRFEQFFANLSEAKTKKMGFLPGDTAADRKMFAEKRVLSSRAVTTMNTIKEGIVIKKAQMLFGARALAISQYLKGIENQSLKSTMPPIRNSVNLSVKPEGVKC
jgi:Putative conjugal transfer nickase/helicase TraI C-term/Putative helicase